MKIEIHGKKHRLEASLTFNAGFKSQQTSKPVAAHNVTGFNVAFAAATVLVFILYFTIVV